MYGAQLEAIIATEINLHAGCYGSAKLKNTKQPILVLCDRIAFNVAEHRTDFLMKQTSSARF